MHPSGFSCQLALVVCGSRSPERKHPAMAHWQLIRIRTSGQCFVSYHTHQSLLL
nr:MAG TPA: hypothetical protein [Caudoviricetes sp.]